MQHWFACLMVFVSFMISWPTFAAEISRPLFESEVIHGGSLAFQKAGGDTINLMAGHRDPTNGPGEPLYYGDFEDASGSPAWNGWTHYDVTQKTETYWNVSNYNQPDPANHAAWCGDINLPACQPGDTLGGYGSSWHELIEFRRTVPHPDQDSQVTVTANLMYDTEPGYDYLYFSYLQEDGHFTDVRDWDGRGTEMINVPVTFLPHEYKDGTDVVIYFRFRSDGGFSDQDCAWPTRGACQIDDINVHLVNGAFTADYFEDFENGTDAADFGLWDVSYPFGVGDFAKIWSGLRDVDICVGNLTPQVAFIDDGLVVPGTGGTQCLTWCYGPGGYIVNNSGGLAGPSYHIHNAIESPVMAWAHPNTGTGPDDDGILFEFGLYSHEDLSMDSPGVFMTWGVRSADTDNSAGNGFQDITDQAWQDRGFLGPYYPGKYGRPGDDVTDLMSPGRDEVQVQLAVYELGWVWGWNGSDGTPAPYFDNVTVKIFPYLGPGLTARELDLAQDNFPERGSIDMADLGSHHVRFDSANNISLTTHMRNDPGDTIVVDAVPVRSGAALVANPEMHYIVDRNPLFDAYRSSGLPAVGSVAGSPAVGSSGTATPGKWAFDLPDTGFLFPGDVLHYYISATDAVGGPGGSDPQTSLVPADTTGFSTGFGYPLGYDSTFTVRALPSLLADGSHPEVLFLNDFGNRGGENLWYMALNNIGLLIEEDYDVYYTNAPSSGVGNGIGGRATPAVLSGYREILYTSGDLSVHTISNGDYQDDAGDDVGVLTQWLDLGGKDMFLSGDSVAMDLANNGTPAQDFLLQYMGLLVNTDIVRPYIDNQFSPLVKATGGLGNPVFQGILQSWIAYGGCSRLNAFDAVVPTGAAVGLAEFTNPSGATGAYPFSAITLNQKGTSRIISMPYDLMFVYTDPSAAGHYLPGRALLLQDVLQYFGVVYMGGISGLDVPGITFRAGNHPNPFNPSTTIFYSLPQAGHLKLSVYNVRGQLVRTLVDGVRPAGEDQKAVWDGRDNLGSAVASGVYFYEARSGADVSIGKMTLVK